MVIQSSFLSRDRTIAAFSILKCFFVTNWFNGFRFTTSRQEPSFLVTVNILLTNWPVQGETFLTAALFRSLEISTSTCSASNGGGGVKGGATAWRGLRSNSRLYHLTADRTHGYEVTADQLGAQRCSLPATWKDFGSIWDSVRCK